MGKHNFGFRYDFEGSNFSFCVPTLNAPVYPGQNRKIREILGILIGCLEDWEKTDNNILIKKNVLIKNLLFSTKHDILRIVTVSYTHLTLPTILLV